VLDIVIAIKIAGEFVPAPLQKVNRRRYAELFKMNEQQLSLFESLQDREALYMRRDGLTKVVRLNLDRRSYATFSTKPKDRVRRSRLIAKYGLTEGITRFAQGETE
jgi:type IV secretion system protein VirB4